MTRVIEFRDVRPNGSVLSTWVCEEGREFGQDYSQFGPGMWPQPPWERQRREPGGEWVTIASVFPGQVLLEPGSIQAE